MKTPSKDSLFHRIEQAVRGTDLSTFDKEAVVAGDGDLLQLLIKFSPGMQLILGHLSQWPLLKPSWRAFIRAFSTTLDGVVNSADPTFKAGKDL
jgi:hypothetical protein